LPTAKPLAATGWFAAERRSAGAAGVDPLANGKRTATVGCRVSAFHVLRRCCVVYSRSLLMRGEAE
jgi:hypothetical protein